MVCGFPFDNMHTTLLDMTKFMWELWGQISSIDLNIIKKKNIDDRLLSIQLSHKVHKLPHAISDASNYKGKNWRSCLLYYSISVCLDSIPTTNLFHALLENVFTSYRKVKS